MALVVKDRVKQTTTTTGTGSVVLNGTVDSFQTFTSALANGDTTYYAIVEPSTNSWEVGLGTWTESTATLARTTILESSNAGSAINLTAGEAEVFITYPAEKSVYLDANGNINATGNVDVAGTLDVTGAATFDDSVTIQGDLTVNGTTTTVNATNLAVADNMIYLNDGSTTTNPDLGWAGNYNDGTYAHAGVFRDASDATFKFYDGYTPEPGISIDTTHASFSLADVDTGNLDVTGNISVTGTVDGRDVASDGSKLDGIEAGATGDQTPSEILTAVKTVDGSGSGLDADLLDGQQGSYYLDWTHITNKPDPSVTLSGDVSGSATMTDLGSINITTTVANDSHTHDGRYYTETEVGNFFSGTTAITGYNKSNWDTAYGWGNHASAGYLAASSYTASDVLTKIKTVDGSGSGLDADLLDGIHLSAVRQGIEATALTSSDDLDTITTNGHYRWSGSAPSNSPSGTYHNMMVLNDGGQPTQMVWGGTGSGTADIHIRRRDNGTWQSWTTFWNSGNDGSESGLDADLLDGYDTSTGGNRWGVIPVVGNDGVMEVGKYIDFHESDADTSDKSARLWSNSGVLTSDNSLYVSGNVSLSGTVDGRDVAADGSKLDGIENGATADQTASEILTAIKTVDGSGSGLDADTVDGLQASQFLRSDTSDTMSGTLTLTGTVDHTGLYNGIYHGIVEDRYYSDDYNGARNLSAFLETQRSDIIRYRPVSNLEYWDGSAWQDGSSQLSNLKLLLDGRKDTVWQVPSTYYKFRFTVTANTSWPLRALIGLETSWTGSTYPGCQMLVEELQTDSSWVTKVTADFTSSNGVTNWGTMFRADSALHTGRGSQANATRITIDFSNWTPSNPSYVTVPLQNIFVLSNHAGTENNDYKSLLDYDQNLNAPANITVSGTVDGRDVAADGAKLDGIEAGAEVNPTASELLTSIKTVDGSGSGLDADTLDGLQSTQFLRSDQSDSTSGTLTMGSGTVSAGTPIFRLNDINSTNTTDQVGYISFQNQGTETGWVGFGSGTNSDITLRNTNGNVVLSPSSGEARVGSNRILTTADEGSGSGLDADTVDGIQASSFLRSDADDTFTGNLTGSSASISLGHNVSAIDNTIGASNWFRSSGTTGWYNTTYNTGIRAISAGTLETYNNGKLNVTSTASDALNVSGGITTSGDVVINGTGNYLQFPDGTQQTTAAPTAEQDYGLITGSVTLTNDYGALA